MFESLIRRLKAKEERVTKVGSNTPQPVVRTREDIEAVFAEIDRILADDLFMPAGEPDDPPSQPDPRHFFEW